MNVKRFQTFSRFIAIFLLFSIIMQFIVLLFLVTTHGWSLDTESTSLKADGFYFSVHNLIISDFYKELAAKIALITASLGVIIALWQGRAIFLALTKGTTPFQPFFVKKLKVISKLIVAVDILPFVVYSVGLTLLARSGYHFQIQVGYWTIIGLIVYCAAEILNYGISLQELSDDTI